MSKCERGAVFSESILSAGSRSAVQSATARVLLIDDDAMWRYLTSSALRERGFEVQEADSATDLLERLAQGHPHLVILDAMMPGLDGFAACRLVRDCPEHTLLPVLMMTSLDDESAISRAYEAGASDFFIKSTHWALLAERVRHLLRMAEMQHDLRASHQRLAEAQSAGGVGSFDLDVESGVLSGAPGSFAMFGLNEHLTAVQLAQLRSLIDPGSLSTFDQAMRDSIRLRVPLHCEFGVRVADSDTRLVRMEATPLVNDSGRVTALTGVLYDVTEQREVQDELTRMTRFDRLTGLPNRASFLVQCAEAIAAARAGGWSVAVAVADIDRFAHVNERFGQVGGDDLLCQMGRRLDLALNTGEARHEVTPLRRPMLARLAGDDFAVLLPCVHDVAEVEARLERLHETMRQPIDLVGGPCMVSASMGVALYPRDGDSAGLLLSRADLATSTVKAQGRNGVHWYSPALDQKGQVKLELAADLRRAIEQGELELHYQTIVDVQRRVVHGVEALMRWRKRGALVSPADFIPLAEETGLIIPMGEWAIYQACRQVSHWKAEGMAVGVVAINLPSAHFERLSLLHTVQRAMGDHALPPGSLELELTETGLVRDLDRTLPKLLALRDAGVAIAIDDFGTGYSSLAYLARLPVAQLKIDRSFVSEMGVSPQADTIVRAIIALGRGLGLELVAEGVETVAQVHQLQALGCALMQGFLFGRPVAPSGLRETMDAALRAVDRCADGARALPQSTSPLRTA